jgi:hypothetical protein
MPGWDGIGLSRTPAARASAMTTLAFTGVKGLFMAKLLGRVRRKMLGAGLPAVLADLDDGGRLRAGSTLKPKF